MAVKIHDGVKKDGYYEGCVFIRVPRDFSMLEYRNQTIVYERCLFCFNFLGWNQCGLNNIVTERLLILALIEFSILEYKNRTLFYTFCEFPWGSYGVSYVLVQKQEHFMRMSVGYPWNIIVGVQNMELVL